MPRTWPRDPAAQGLMAFLSSPANLTVFAWNILFRNWILPWSQAYQSKARWSPHSWSCHRTASGRNIRGQVVCKHGAVNIRFPVPTVSIFVSFLLAASHSSMSWEPHACLLQHSFIIIQHHHALIKGIAYCLPSQMPSSKHFRDIIIIFLDKSAPSACIGRQVFNQILGNIPREPVGIPGPWLAAGLPWQRPLICRTNPGSRLVHKGYLYIGTPCHKIICYLLDCLFIDAAHCMPCDFHLAVPAFSCFCASDCVCAGVRRALLSPVCCRRQPWSYHGCCHEPQHHFLMFFSSNIHIVFMKNHLVFPYSIHCHHPFKPALLTPDNIFPQKYTSSMGEIIISENVTISVLYCTPASVENAASATGRVLISLVLVTINGHI